MKIVEINVCDYGSTGRIMLRIAEKIRQNGDECKVVVPNGRHNSIKNKKDYIHFSNRLSEDSHLMLGYLTGYQGCFSIISTRQLVQKLNEFKPDIIHLHNLHNCYINLPILFDYIKNNNIRIVWTLHDCWSFTGQCPYFTLANCDKWKEGCFKCPSYRLYPKSIVDRTRKMWKLKKKWFTGIKDMTIVTPSQWLADLVKQSFLRDYPVMVIYNGIDLDVFKPTLSDFRSKYHLENKYILLGVAFGWGKRKGFDVFIELSKKLDDRFKIVLVGTNDELDKQLPENIISIHRTNNQTELAQIYTAADLFVNPTREEVLGMVNVESLACGTPVLTFKTGGCPEILDEKTGYIVDVDDIEELKKQIVKICTEKIYTENDCLKRARNFDMNLRFNEYIDLFKALELKTI